MAIERYFFTHCPSGTGYDVRQNGYQTKACSSGFGTLRPMLERLGTHLGETLRVHPPESSTAVVSAWRRSAKSLATMPSQVCESFPVVWSLREDGSGGLWLSRANYIGLDHAGRPGNVLVQTLGLPPNTLDAVEGRATYLFGDPGFFRDPKDLPRGDIPPLDALAYPADGATFPALDYGVRKRLEPVLASLLTRIARARAKQTPVLVVLADWRAAVPLVGHLLDHLPSDMRSRISFITYEHDPEWRLSPGGDSSPAEHDLIIHCPPGASDRGPTPSKYPKFAVFNLVSGEQSEPPSPSAYVEFAVRCRSEKEEPLLAQHHALARELGVDGDLEACDLLVGWFDVDADEVPLLRVKRRLGVLGNVVRSESQAGVALGRIREDWEAAMMAGDGAVWIEAASGLRILFDRLVPPGSSADPSTLPDIYAWVTKGVRESLAAGEAERVLAWLGVASVWRHRILSESLQEVVQALGHVEQSAGATLDVGKAASWTELAGAALHVALQAETKPGAADAAVSSGARLLLAYLSLGARGRLETNEEVWRQVASDVERILFAGAGSKLNSPESKALLLRCDEIASPDLLPSAAAWLAQRCVELVSGLDEDRVSRRLETMVRASRQHTKPAELLAKALELAGVRISQPHAQALVVGRLAECARSSVIADEAYQRYRERRSAKGVDCKSLDRQLAEAGALGILARDFIEVLVQPVPVPVFSPSDRPASDKKAVGRTAAPTAPAATLPLQERLHAWVQRQPVDPTRARDELSAVLAEMYPRIRENCSIQELVWHLLASEPFDGGAAAAGGIGLISAVVRFLDLDPLEDRLARRLEELASVLPSDTARRLSTLLHAGAIQDQARRPGWSLSLVDLQQPFWTTELETLEESERKDFAGRLQLRAAESGLRTPDEVARFAEILRRLEPANPRGLSDRFLDLVRGRDTVTIITVIGAVLGAVAAERLDRADGLTLVREVLRLLPDQGKGDRSMVVDHLDHGFGPTNELYQDQLHSLRLELDLLPPPPPAEPEKKGMFGRIFGRR